MHVLIAIWSPRSSFIQLTLLLTSFMANVLYHCYQSKYFKNYSKKCHPELRNFYLILKVLSNETNLIFQCHVLLKIPVM